MTTAPDLFSYRRYWAHKFTPAPFLPMNAAGMADLGWNECDIVIVTGDAYVDHPSFGMAVIGRVLEAQGFRVGIISQPDWRDCEAFRALGRPRLFFGVTGGNMDSMVNRYTSDRRVRSDDAYTPGGAGGKRPDRPVIVYSQRCREAWRDVPVVIGGIEASLRRIAHFDYWQEKVRRSILLDAKADILLYGNAERAIVALAHRMAAGEAIGDITDLRGTALRCRDLPDDMAVVDSSGIDTPGAVDAPADPYALRASSGKPCAEAAAEPPTAEPSTSAVVEFTPRAGRLRAVRLPDFDAVRDDPVLYSHASRVLHLESNPHNARTLLQRHGDQWVRINPPPLPLTTPELDRVFELPYQRAPHPAYGEARIPAWEMIRHSVNIMRGCFGGCTFCSITEHEGRIIQNRSEASILREIEAIRDTSPAFTGVISDLGGPTANMWRLACKDRDTESRCRRLSCVHPTICKNLETDQAPLASLYRKAREVPGVKKVLIASGLRYDLAVRTPEYVKELVTHHVGGYLKIAPEHTEEGPLSKMMKPGMGSYHRFRELFDKYSKEAGKEQYLIPYFIAAHPGTTDEDMLALAQWLKRNGFRADQVQAFLPSPMAMATAMWHSGKNPLRRVRRDAEDVYVPKGRRQRRLHKAFLRYHDPENWPLLREALRRMGRAELIGNGKRHLVPNYQPPGTGRRGEGSRAPRKGDFQTRHAPDQFPGSTAPQRAGRRGTARPARDSRRRG